MTLKEVAALGREEDDMLAHVASGEVVIPQVIFEKVPGIKTAFSNAGLNVAKYTIGDPANSINPATGLREFKYGADTSEGGATGFDGGDRDGGEPSALDQAMGWAKKGSTFGPLGMVAGGLLGWGMHPSTPKTMGDPGGYNTRDGGGDMVSRFKNWQVQGGQGNFRDFMRSGAGQVPGVGGPVNPVTGEPLYPETIDYAAATQAGVSPPAGGPLYGVGSPFVGPADVFGGT